jgi:hypothetical protein
MTVLEAFDLLRFSGQLQDRLLRAQESLAARQGLERENEWLVAATDLLEAVREPALALMDRARGLPELATAVQETAAELQSEWVDSLEKLLAGITFRGSNRAPIIQALFPHVKLAVLRRAPSDVASAYAADFERRQKGGYVTRMLETEDYAFARPVLDMVAAARERWQEYTSAPTLSEQDAAALRVEMLALGERLDVAVKQARLLAEAALIPIDGAFDRAGLNAKPRKRPARPAAAPTAPAATEEPPAAPAKKEPVSKKAKKAAPRKAARK